MIGRSGQATVSNLRTRFAFSGSPKKTLVAAIPAHKRPLFRLHLLKWLYIDDSTAIR